jgi:hypothetical protein
MRRMNFVLLIVTTAPLTRSTSGATLPASVATAPGGGAATADGGHARQAAASPSGTRPLAAINDNPARGIIRGESDGDLVTEDDADAVLAQFTAEVREDLMPVLELDAKIAGGQHLDDASLKLYMLFAAHGGADLTRSQGLGQ